MREPQHSGGTRTKIVKPQPVSEHKKHAQPRGPTITAEVKQVEVPVEKIVEKLVEIPIEKIVQVPVEKRVEVPVEKIVQVPVEKIVTVDKVVDRILEVPVEKIVTVEKIVEHRVEVPVHVEKIVEIPGGISKAPGENGVEVSGPVAAEDSIRVEELEALQRRVAGLVELVGTLRAAPPPVETVEPAELQALNNRVDELRGQLLLARLDDMRRQIADLKASLHAEAERLNLGPLNASAAAQLSDAQALLTAADAGRQLTVQEVDALQKRIDTLVAEFKDAKAGFGQSTSAAEEAEQTAAAARLDGMLRQIRDLKAGLHAEAKRLEVGPLTTSAPVVQQELTGADANRPLTVQELDELQGRINRLLLEFEEAKKASNAEELKVPNGV